MLGQGCVVVWSVRFEKSRGGFVVKDLRFINGNCVEELTGYSKEEFIKNPHLLMEIIYPEDRGVFARLKESIFRGKHVGFETRLRRKDGVCVRVSHLVVPRERKSKGVESVYVIRSIPPGEFEQTDGKRYRELFERMLEHLPAGVFMYRDKVVFANKAYEEITGYTISELKNMHIWDIFADSDQREKMKSIARKRIECEGGPIVYKHTPFYMRDGSLRYLNVYTDTLELIDGCAGFGIAIDVTEEKILRDKLEEENLLLNVLTEESPAAVMIYGEKPIYANRVLHEILGYKPEDLKERYVWELVGEELREAVREAIERRLKGENFTSFYPRASLITRDGGVRYMDIVSSTVRYGGKNLGIFVGVDVTSEKEKEEALKSLYNMYVILSNINQAIVRVSSEKDVLKSACEAFVKGDSFKSAVVWCVDEEEQEIYPEYACGDSRCPVFSERVLLSEENRGEYPVLRCFFKKKIVVSNNIQRDSHLGHWRELLLSSGFLSMAFIPLMRGRSVVGILGVFANRAFVFNDSVYHLLKEVSDDLSFALESIEKEKWMSIYNSVLEHGTDWVVITDREGTIVYANNAVERISGYKKDELLGKNPRIFKSGVHDKEFYKNMWDTILSGNVFNSIVIDRAKNGELFRLNKTITPVFMNGDIQYFVSVDKDITHEKKLEELIFRLSTIDPVTHLPNRKAFIDQASSFFEEMKYKDSIAAVVIVSPSGVSEINQVFSFEEGDKVLRKIGAVLRKIVRSYDVVAKLVGDRFAVLLKDLKSKEDILSIVNKMKNALFEEVNVKGDVKLSYNMGIAVYPDDGVDIRDLLSKAEVAVSYAHDSGENIHAFFQKALGEKITRDFNVRVELARAIRDEEFVLFYQPYFDTITGELRGAEVLLRWNKKGEGIVMPGEFIPVLERTNMIVDVEKWLVNKVCMNVQRWRDLGVKSIPLSINVSPQSFSVGRIEKDILSAVDKFGVDPSLLTVEIVERMFMDNLEKAKEVLLRLKDVRVAVAIDDFGTGYSSLSYLKALPVDILKIDISFTREITEDKDTLAIVDAIINLANKLNMMTIAEGVETRQQLSLLKDLKCNMVQGFLLSKPLPEMEFLKILLRNNHA